MVYASDLSPDGFGYESSSLSTGTSFISENDMNEKANKELDNLIDWISHNGGWARAPINETQRVERSAELAKRTKHIRAALKE